MFIVNTLDNFRSCEGNHEKTHERRSDRNMSWSKINEKGHRERKREWAMSIINI